MTSRLRVTLLLGVALLCTGGTLTWARQQSTAFPHGAHAKFFVECALCHAGIEQPGASRFPAPSSCAACHDGATAKRVPWQPRATPRISNLRFDHRRHDSIRTRLGAKPGCVDCHADRGSSWMVVRPATATQCVACHSGGLVSHLAMPDNACATCHLPLAEAVTLPQERVAAFAAPPSHREGDFLTAAGHGVQAKHTTGTAHIAASCSTCHSRELCVNCHVNAPEQATIQALALDPRWPVRHATVTAPANHRLADFETRHGQMAGTTAASCATCHTQESCLACHRLTAPKAVLALKHAGPGRAAGAQTTSRAPASHRIGWKTQHAVVATTTMRSCMSCHARSECLVCHVPDPTRRGNYHPASYLTRHPADAYSRASSCTNCHNTGEFCQSCHKQGGLTAKRTLIGVTGYHDGDRQFPLGHGQAARQALETCVSCHVERDCLTCHSSVKGRSFSPHGPSFDAERLLKKNPQLCMACHGTAIPRRPR